MFIRFSDVFCFVRRRQMHSTKVEDKCRIGVIDFGRAQSNPNAQVCGRNATDAIATYLNFVSPRRQGGHLATQGRMLQRYSVYAVLFSRKTCHMRQPPPCMAWRDCLMPVTPQRAGRSRIYASILPDTTALCNLSDLCLFPISRAQPLQTPFASSTTARHHHIDIAAERRTCQRFPRAARFRVCACPAPDRTFQLRILDLRSTGD